MSSAGTYPSLAKPVKLGAIQTVNSTLMASLTRNRSVPVDIPNDYNIEYYTQRAEGGAGLIFSEGTLVTPQGTEWPHAPGIYDEEHAAGWKKVIDAVHAKGTPIVAQLWHLGRVSHPDMEQQKVAGVPVYGPSAVAARGGKFRDLPGEPGYITPEAVPDPQTLIDQFVNAAKMAKIAGFDGVEYHSANGYLGEQFLSDTSNVREDKWGGSVENRCRFGLEVVKGLIGVYGADRVGIKLSPCGGYNDAHFTSKESLLETFKYYVAELDALNIAWMQIMQYNAYGDAKFDGKPQGFDHDTVETYGPLIKNSNLIANCGYTAETGEKELNNKDRNVKAMVYGHTWIANPDLAKRFQSGQELSQPDVKTFYQIHENDPSVGYSDYPVAKTVDASA